jgi:hypothetical protein
VNTFFPARGPVAHVASIVLSNYRQRNTLNPRKVPWKDGETNELVFGQREPMTERFSHAILAAAVSAAVAVDARSAGVSWVLPGDGTWNVALNWSSFPLLPDANDDVMIALEGTRTVSFVSGTRGARSVTISGDNSFSMLGGRLTVIGAFNSAQPVEIKGGTLILNGLVSTVRGLNMLNGLLGGRGVVIVDGPMKLTGTTMTGSGTTILTGAVARTSTAVSLDAGRTLVFASDTAMANYGMVLNADVAIGAGTVVIRAGNTFEDFTSTMSEIMTVDHDVRDDGSDARVRIEGTWRKTGNGTTKLAVQVVNTGALQLVAGILRTSDRFTHSGAIEVSGGLLDMVGGVESSAGGAGSMSVGAAGNARIGAASTLGTVNLAAGGALTLDAPLTINTDFVNSNSGAGNAFNRRGGIAGSGQLLAGGAPIQTVVGNGIANSSSLTPSITLASVRAGSINQYSFSIVNNGNNPALRGALQTSANGGNLTDSQFRFTAANFGPGSVHTLTFAPDGAGALSIAPNQRIAVVSQFDNVATQLLSIQVDPNAKVYTPAVLGQSLGNVNFGVVRVGNSATRNVGTISNTAAASALNDVLATSFSGTGAPFTLSDPGALGGGQSATLTATLDTRAARASTTQNVTANFASRNPDMADLALGSTGFALTGQVNNLAQAAFRIAGGAGVLILPGADSFLLDFGDIAQGATGIVTTRLAVWNRAPAGAPSDRLTGVLQPKRGPASSAFTYGGFSGHFDLDTDQDSLELLLDLSTARTGVFTDTLLLTELFSVYAGLADLALPQGRLDLRLSVIDPTTVIPLPGAAWLLLGGLIALGATARRRPR